MVDINYFLDAEKKFRQDHPNGPEPIYDQECANFTYKSYPDDFLEKGWMNKIAKARHSEEVNSAMINFNLTTVEVFIMKCFYGRLSSYFRDDQYEVGKIPEIAQKMQEVLESFIRKAPKHNEGVLYRFLNLYDKSDFKIGDVFEPLFSLTTTNLDWKQDKNVYVITPLSAEYTSAYDIYRIYNHNKENQVNFLKGTKFKVTKIEDAPNGYRRIYLNELSPNSNCKE